MEALAHKRFLDYEQMTERGRALLAFDYRISASGECVENRLKMSVFYPHFLDSDKEEKLKDLMAKAETQGFYKYLLDSSFRENLGCESQYLKRAAIMVNECSAYKTASESDTWSDDAADIPRILQSCKSERARKAKP